MKRPLIKDCICSCIYMCRQICVTLFTGCGVAGNTNGSRLREALKGFIRLTGNVKVFLLKNIISLLFSCCTGIFIFKLCFALVIIPAYISLTAVLC